MVRIGGPDSPTANSTAHSPISCSGSRTVVRPGAQVAQRGDVVEAGDLNISWDRPGRASRTAVIAPTAITSLAATRHTGRRRRPELGEARRADSYPPSLVNSPCSTSRREAMRGETGEKPAAGLAAVDDSGPASSTKSRSPRRGDQYVCAERRRRRGCRG